MTSLSPTILACNLFAGFAYRVASYAVVLSLVGSAKQRKRVLRRRLFDLGDLT
jgi:hypothetical protein